nr:hypothetical protein CFP56_16861 [Quercus suber]
MRGFFAAWVFLEGTTIFFLLDCVQWIKSRGIGLLREGYVVKVYSPTKDDRLRFEIYQDSYFAIRVPSPAAPPALAPRQTCKSTVDLIRDWLYGRVVQEVVRPDITARSTGTESYSRRQFRRKKLRLHPSLDTFDALLEVWHLASTLSCLSPSHRSLFIDPEPATHLPPRSALRRSVPDALLLAHAPERPQRGRRKHVAVAARPESPRSIDVALLVNDDVQVARLRASLWESFQPRLGGGRRRVRERVEGHFAMRISGGPQGEESLLGKRASAMPEKGDDDWRGRTGWQRQLVGGGCLGRGLRDRGERCTAWRWREPGGKLLLKRHSFCFGGRSNEATSKPWIAKRSYSKIQEPLDSVALGALIPLLDCDVIARRLASSYVIGDTIPASLNRKRGHLAPAGTPIQEPGQPRQRRAF